MNIFFWIFYSKVQNHAVIVKIVKLNFFLFFADFFSFDSGLKNYQTVFVFYLSLVKKIVHFLVVPRFQIIRQTLNPNKIVLNFQTYFFIQWLGVLIILPSLWHRGDVKSIIYINFYQPFFWKTAHKNFCINWVNRQCNMKIAHLA